LTTGPVILVICTHFQLGTDFGDHRDGSHRRREKQFFTVIFHVILAQFEHSSSSMVKVENGSLAKVIVK
jgi:hypothetical protein